MTVTENDVKKIRKQGLKDKLGVEGMESFIQMYSECKGNYTMERDELLKDVTIEDFEKFLEEC